MLLKSLKISHQVTIPFCNTSYSDFNNPEEIDLLDCEDVGKDKDPNELELSDDEEVNKGVDPSEIDIDDL